MKAATSSSSPPVYPTVPASAYSPLSATEDSEPTVGYPAVVDGLPCDAYLPPAPRPRRRRHRRAACCACCCIFFLLLLAVAAFFVWPRSLDMDIGDLSLAHISFNVKRGDSIIPRLFLNITLNLRVIVQNPNFFAVTYETLTVSILYQGDEVGEVESHGGNIKARATSYADATLELDSYEITSNVLLLIADIASGAVPVRTVTAFNGHLNVLLFQIPLEGKVSCDLVIDPGDQTVLSQDCGV